MQNRLREILKCEESYIRCFCEVADEGDIVRYKDEELKDMYDHNFIVVKDSVDESKMQEIATMETEKASKAHADFMKMKVSRLPKKEIASWNGKKAEAEISGIYLCHKEALKNWVTRSDCKVSQITTEEQVEELVQLDLVHDEERCGRDFCYRRARRRGKVYRSSEYACNSYICYLEGKPIGNCDLFMDGQVAKIEDFAVIPEYQRKGVGTTLLLAMVRKAQELGAKVIYLIADEDDTPKEMYIKLGFEKLGELYCLFFEL